MYECMYITVMKQTNMGAIAAILCYTYITRPLRQNELVCDKRSVNTLYTIFF